ncbi:MAG TPA: arginine--tRNA ligase [Candidatus Paceibacterota bacterium]|jgi:arginyl-tRNA synthetase
MYERIRSIVGAELARLGAGDVDFAVEWPAELAHGDFATNAAMAAAKSLGKAPREIAEALVPALKEALGADAARVVVAGPGFVNITLSAAAVSRELEGAIAAGKAWGMSTLHRGERVLVEYSCPNPFKEMHIGHLMSTVIGESVARIFAASGATVLKDSYGGDVGPHVAKTLWALRKKGVTEPATVREVGDAYTHGSRAYEESEEVKKEIDALNVELYTVLAAEQAAHTEAQRELFDLWRKGRDAALAGFRDIYKVLDTSFDYFIFESETTPIGLTVVRDGLAQGIFEESEGAVIYRGEKKGLHTLVFITSRGTPTYETKDVGLAFLKEEKMPNDRSYILTGAEQIGHFKVFLAALEDIAPLVAQKTKHIPHGLLQLATGKMSSREGNVITAKQLIEDVMERAGERNEDPVVAEQVAIGALKYMILRSAPGGNIIFDPEKSLSLEGDSGPYLQYATVRAVSIIASADALGTAPEAPDEVYDIARLITRFPDVVLKAQALEAPHVIAQYLTQLAGEWNSFYAQERILGGEHEAYKLALARAFVTTMQNGLALLGIPAPERM